MASYIPPSEQLPIFDNAVFESSTSGSLTIAQANLLYLRKTFPDTATAVETFQAGLKTNSILHNDPAAVLFIGSDGGSPATTMNIKSDTIVIGTPSAGTLNTYSANSTFQSGLMTVSSDTTLSLYGLDLQVGYPGVTSNMYLDSYYNTIRSVYLNLNSTVTTANTVAIGNFTGTNYIDINSNNELRCKSYIIDLNSNNLSANEVYIGSDFTTACDVNTTALTLNSGMSIANSVAIGNATGTTTMNMNGTTPININNGLKSNSYDVITAGTVKNFFNSQTGPCTIFQNLGVGQGLNVGNYAVAQACRIGNIEFTQNLMNNGSTPINGNIDIGSKQTGTFGTIDIGTNVARTGAINLAVNGAGANVTPINLGGVATSAIINVNRPLTLGYNASAITTGSSSTQKGNRYAPTLSSSTATLGVATSNMCSWTTPIGVWMFEVNFTVATTTGVLRVDFSVSNTSLTVDASRSGGGNTPNGQGGIINGSGVIVNTSSSTWYLTGSSSVAASITNIIVNITRIA